MKSKLRLKICQTKKEDKNSKSNMSVQPLKSSFLSFTMESGMMATKDEKLSISNTSDTRFTPKGYLQNSQNDHFNMRVKEEDS